MVEWKNKSGNIRVNFWLWPSIIISIILTIALNLVFWLFTR